MKGLRITKIIALNTFKEILRDRILFSLVIFAILLIGFSLVLGELSFSEQSRISMNFGLTGIHLSAITISIFLGSTLVSKEIEKQTVFTVLTRPVSRFQFLIGKAFGLGLVNVLLVCGLSAVLFAVVIFLGWTVGPSFFVAIYGIVLESLLLLAVTLLFGMVTGPFMTVAFSVAIFLIGHWLNDLEYFAQKSTQKTFQFFALSVARLLPDLERFNWRSMVLYDDKISFQHMLFASSYGIWWTVALLLLAGYLFERKDFV